MKGTSKFGVTALGSAAVVLAIAGLAFAQPGTGTSAPKDKQPAPGVTPSNTAPAADKDKGKPAAPSTKTKPGKATAIKVGEPAPEWSLKDDKNETVALKDLRGKVVLVDFWATWCGPCRMVMPEIQKLHEQFGDKGLVVLGMNTWEGRDKLTPEAADAQAVKFKHDNKYTYRGLLRADDAAKAYGVSGIPAMFVIGPDGKLVGQWIGADSASVAAMKSAVKTAVDDLAKGKGATDAAKPGEGTGAKAPEKKSDK